MNNVSPDPDEGSDATVYAPLLDRDVRRRRREMLESGEPNPTPAFAPETDFTLATGFEPGVHTVHVPQLPLDVRRHVTSVEYDTDADGRLTPRTVPLVLNTDGGHELPWGLVPLLAQAARWRCRNTSADSSRSSHPIQPFPSELSDPLVPAQLLEHRRLVVRYALGVCPAALIVGLVRALPGRRVAVVVARRRDGGQLVNDLRAEGIDARGFYSGGDFPASPPRVAVGTSSGLTSTAAQHTGCSVVVTLDAVNFVGSGGVSLRAEEAWLDAYWLGLVDDRAVSPLERDRLTCFFGPAELDIPAHGEVRREVLFTSQPIVLPAGGGYDRVVMTLAGEFARRHPASASSRFGVVREAAEIPGPVVVVAHHERHRRELVRVQRPTDRTRVRVVTPSELAGLDDVGVLVRADDRPHRPPFADSQLVERQTHRTPLLVVDAVGPGADHLARRTSAYRAAGWVSLEAYSGGWGEWGRWLHRRLPDGSGRV